MENICDILSAALHPVAPLDIDIDAVNFGNLPPDIYAILRLCDAGASVADMERAAAAIGRVTNE